MLPWHSLGSAALCLGPAPHGAAGGCRRDTDGPGREAVGGRGQTLLGMHLELCHPEHPQPATW